MASVASAVRSVLAEDPLLAHCLASGLVNVRALARSIRREVESRAGGPAELAAVVNAVHRYRDHPSTREALARVGDGCRASRVRASSGLVRAEVRLAEGSLRALDALRAHAPDVALHLAASGDRLTVVADRSCAEALRRLSPQELAEGVATVELAADAPSPSLAPAVLSLLARGGVEVQCWASTPTGLWACVAESDLAAAVSAVRSLSSTRAGATRPRRA